MGSLPRRTDAIDDLASLARQVNRLRTRSRERNIIQGWQSLAPYLSNGDNVPAQEDDTGWYSESRGDPTLHSDDPTHFGFARFYRDRGRVYFGGAVRWFPPSTGAGNPTICEDGPAGYEPAQPAPTMAALRADPDESPNITDDEFFLYAIRDFSGGGEWITQISPGHRDFLAGPLFGSPPAFTYLLLDHVSYRHA